MAASAPAVPAPARQAGDSASPARDLLRRARAAFDQWRYRRKVEFWKRSGVRFGRGVMVMPTADLDACCSWMIAIGDGTRIAHHVRILVHDASAQRDLHHTKLAPVTIGRECLIAERVIILPGVTIGDRVMVCAGSVVVNDLPSNTRAMGVPARVYGTFDAYLEETARAIDAGPRFTDPELDELPEPERWRVLEQLRAGGGYAYSRGRPSLSDYYVTPP